MFSFFARPRSHFLAFLLCALILPSATVVLVAVFSMLSQERAMEAAVSSYVQDLAESMSYHLSSDTDAWTFQMLSDFTRYPFFSWGPSIPGWVALTDHNGKVILASPGASNINAIWKPDLPVGQAVRITDKKGAQYTLAVYPVKRPSGGYVVAAVSWSNLLGGLVSVIRLWPVLIILITLTSFVSIRLLWTKLVIPLQALVAEIDSMTLGTDVPDELEDGTIMEIESVHDALMRSAQAAIERDNLRNSYVKDVVRAQEQERLDMAREIHDGPLQDVTALLQQIHMTLDEDDDESAEVRIRRAEIIAKSVVRELRALCDELAPPWMDLGLSEAVTELAERLSQGYDIQIVSDFDDASRELDIDNEKILSLLRIIQEAVSNAVRHGGASEVHIHFRMSGNLVTMMIADNGKGFDAANINHETLRVEGHRGLASMTERMSLMGGSVRINSKLGKGTNIIASFRV
ncbi:MAG: sensor histidine kinase [Synergistaceae bacterium]|nr:sensor histidine kinase [Synergistaceae bacterium]